MDAKINGIRVWYSSFSSVDWLHDAIKDSVRFAKLRRRKSIRARIHLLFDKSLGWIIVTIVGFLTAVIAFMVVRTEQYLFDLKEGYCLAGWYKAKRFCCPPVDETQYFLLDFTNEAECLAWRSWSEAFSWRAGDTGEQFVQYVAYAVVAVSP
jgi:chloride channel 3/4/5